jgi:hypothetical protein
VIGIGPQVEGHEELESLLRQIRPFGGAVRQPLLERYGRSAGLVTIILFAVVFLSNSKSVVTPAGLVLIGLLGWSLVEVQRNKNIDAKTRRGMYMVIFPLFAVLAKLAFLWM